MWEHGSLLCLKYLWRVMPKLGLAGRELESHGLGRKISFLFDYFFFFFFVFEDSLTKLPRLTLNSCWPGRL